MTIPSPLISVLHIPIIMLQRIAIMPFIIMAQLIMPLPIMPIRFCIMRVDISSTPMHVMRIPPVIFSIVIVHRGIIIPIAFPGMLIGALIIPIALASIIMLTIVAPH
jgi:hypothetical protein